MSLLALKAQSQSRDAEEKRTLDRRRAVLILIQRYLSDQGYYESVDKLAAESRIGLDKNDAADNVDLFNIVQEYEEYYEIKFGRRPKLIRKMDPDSTSSGPASRLPDLRRASPSLALQSVIDRTNSMASRGGSQAPSPDPSTSALGGPLQSQPSAGSVGGFVPSAKPPGKPVSGQAAARERRERAAAAAAGTSSAVTAATPTGTAAAAGGDLNNNPLVINKAPVADRRSAGINATDDDDDNEFFERRIIKPLPDMGSSELRELAASITRDIFTSNPNVPFDSIAGLDEAKRLLREAVVMPNKYPQLFRGILAPWKGILLFGPPGNGKTMLAKAVATECRTTFFNISASTIVSKWRGDSEKLIRVLFELARYHAPSTIFLDEIDSIMGSRGGEGEHEASRRMKTELLIQMDGLAKTDDLVFVLCATNLPWELDRAMLRRLEKRIMVPLPGPEARHRILQSLLSGRLDPSLDKNSLETFAGPRTEGYSGSDIYLLAKEAAMRPLRRLMKEIEGIDMNASNAGAAKGGSSRAGLLSRGGSSAATSTAPHLSAAQREAVEGGKVEELLGKISMEDLEAALQSTRPTAAKLLKEYDAFVEEMGQMG